MRTKNFYLCLLLLVLSTANVWADKYYQPGSYKGGSTPRRTLAELANTGKKFMIYNTCVEGNVDYTGFLRNNGKNVVLDKSKERDLYVYNENYVYTMEGFDTDSDGNLDYYAIKSVTTGTYVDIIGNTSNAGADAAKLYITNWDETPAERRAGVNMESWLYNIIGNAQITSGGHGSTVFVIKNEGSTCWSGETDHFATESTGHPYAFYEAFEVTDGTYLQDLHIYSRSDIYSAQVIYGYVQVPENITLSPAPDADDRGLLLDGSFTTCATTKAGDGDHYFQFDLGKSTDALYIYLQRNADATNIPTSVKLQGSTDGAAWTDIPNYSAIATGLDNNVSYTSGKIELGASYRHIRIVNNTAGAQMSLSEFSILPPSEKVEDALDYLAVVNDPACPVYNKATTRVYTETVENYNKEFPDARLLSGVPLPGNKYRIYADAYDITEGVYENQEIYYDATGDALKTADSGSGYNSAAPVVGKEYFEWYCEDAGNGYIVFKNVADRTKYLANAGISSTPYKWSISTVLTQRFGVPLRNEALQYLAVQNDGGVFWGDVKKVQNQTQAYSYTKTTVNDNGTLDDETDDTEEETDATLDCGLCTDFVFIPVDVLDEEKKITFTAGDLVQRNVAFSYDINGDAVDDDVILPYSRMFLEGEDLPTFTLRCPKFHQLDGCYIDGIKRDDVIKETNGTYEFNFENIIDGDVIDIRLTIKKPFDYYGEGTGTGLYVLRNNRSSSLPQQAGPRRADVDLGGDDDRVSTSTGNYYYAQFNTNSESMKLIEGSENADFDTNEEFDARAFFYFKNTDIKDDNINFYDAAIHSAITPMKLAAHDSWNEVGETYYIQPHSTDLYSGFAIGRTKLGISNNPADFLNSNHANGNKVIDWYANDDGSNWEFFEVSKAVAITELQEFIKNTCDQLTVALQGKIDDNDFTGDKDKAGKYMSYVGNFKTTYGAAIDVETLVTKSQEIHMLVHELDYGLLPLPVPLTPESEPIEPNWYYLKNVESGDYYAKYGNNPALTLDNGAKKLPHMFFFTGEYVEDNEVATNEIADNHLTIDEYLKAHVYNFESGDNTVISKNENLYSRTDNITTGGETIITSSLNLTSNIAWSVSMEYDLDGTAYNAYGSSLLASGKDPATDNYTGNFQVYFKDDRSIVVKVNNSDDRYRFWHTQEAFSHIKVVITSALGNITVDVYNANGEKETMVITKTTLNNITTLSAALPATGATLTNLSVDKVEAMTWGAGDGSNNLWYILPSSNRNNPGLAIVMNSAHDSNMGWTNVGGADQEVFTDLGSSDNSTWQFEKIEHFDGHAEEVLEMFDIKECVIYNKELKDLYEDIMEITDDIIALTDNPDLEEDYFNELYRLVREYKEKSTLAANLRAPKVGAVYTVRHSTDENADRGLAVHVVENIDGGCVTKEVYSADVTFGDKYTGRGAWLFEGTDADGDGYYDLDKPLYMKNLHTQCYLTTPGETSTLVDENKAAVLLTARGDCTAGIAIGEVEEDNNVEVQVETYTRNNSSFGSAAVDPVPDAVQQVITDNGISNATVYCKTIPVTVTEDGNVTVEFKHNGGNHKLNIIAVVLEDGTGAVVKGDYHWGKAGGNHEENIYYLYGVAAGTYNMQCYVFGGGANNDNVNEAAGSITITKEAVRAFNGTYMESGAEEVAATETTVTYTMNNSSFGSAAVASVPGAVQQVITDNNISTATVYCKEIDVTLEANGKIKVTFTHSTGQHKLNIIAVVLAKTNGTAVQGDYHWGKAGGNHVDNVYELQDVVAAGSYKLQCYVFTGGPNSDNVNNAAGTITIATESFKRVNNTGTEATKWIIEEIATPANIFYNVPSLTSATLPDGKAYSTLYLGYNATIPTGVKAWIVRDIFPDNRLDMVEVTGGVVPAGAGVILSSDNALYNKKFEYSAATPSFNAETEGNILTGTAYTKHVDCTNQDVYMLGKKNNRIALYWAYENFNADGEKQIVNGTTNHNESGYVRCNANKSYYEASEGSKASIAMFSFFFGGATTDIDTITDTENDVMESANESGIFDLQGRKLERIIVPCIYIVNGKKVFVNEVE